MPNLRTMAIGVGWAIIGIVMRRVLGKRREESIQATQDLDQSAGDHATLAIKNAKAADSVAGVVVTTFTGTIRSRYARKT